MSSRTKSILTQSGADLLDALAVKHGAVVTFDQIFDELKVTKNRQAVRDTVSKMAKEGWLVRLKKGVYCLSSLAERGSVSLSQIVIAQYLDSAAYISGEAALQYHGLFDQLLAVVRSVTLGRHKTMEVAGTRYEFMRTQVKYFVGYTEEWQGEHRVRVATVEKALIDLLHFNFSVYAADMVLEKLRDSGDAFDWQRLADLLDGESLTTQRIMGFLMERAGRDAAALARRAKGKSWRSRMTAESQHYDAKWHLYYSDHFYNPDAL
jgi:predicted transcriptional regulator of viral defense system